MEKQNPVRRNDENALQSLGNCPRLDDWIYECLGSAKLFLYQRCNSSSSTYCVEASGDPLPRSHLPHDIPPSKENPSREVRTHAWIGYSSRMTIMMCVVYIFSICSVEVYFLYTISYFLYKMQHIMMCIWLCLSFRLLIFLCIMFAFCVE